MELWETGTFKRGRVRGEVAKASANSVIIKFSVDLLRKKAEPSESDFWELMGQEPAVVCKECVKGEERVVKNVVSLFKARKEEGVGMEEGRRSDRALSIHGKL